MSGDMAVPTIEDRQIANAAMRLAFEGFLNNRQWPTDKPFPDDLFKMFVTKSSVINGIAVEIEIAVALARVRERERCAAIAENFGNRDELLGKNVEATCTAIALAIRNPA